MSWILKRIDINPPEIITDAGTCGDHCKEIARKYRKGQDNAQNMIFQIISHDGYVLAVSKANSGWRMKWGRP